ncbi:MAG: chemotaxis protein CheW [Nitrospirae bacterium]|jgi:purine-binding chemotaxis protein CheW|nr:chemotaxis protein CheW [Nitrospirota bacterium]MCL5062513.1 chemotaxis protein CheW [Nitrospirota bacterium]MDA8214971.1 chemotaxis protein CheW [Nitrospiraceae bacterium]MDA8338231.1 chemotaxis protein CheW [Nitrospiraceae bacterium]
MDALAATGLGQVIEGQQYVTFDLNDEEYAVDALKVQEIIELANITKVPHLPEFFKGVINLRGTIIPVVDMKLKFGMNGGDTQKHTCVIVTEFSGGVMGLIVDSVSDVLHMPEESIAATPSFGTHIKTDFIKGMGKVNDRLVLVLDIDRVLTEEEASVISEQLTVSEQVSS